MAQSSGLVSLLGYFAMQQRPLTGRMKKPLEKAKAAMTAVTAMTEKVMQKRPSQDLQEPQDLFAQAKSRR